MDFGSLSLPSKKQRPVDPIEIFESLPRIEGAPNDLWRGQADALREWAENRDELDTLLSLNTGAGKTIVGLLMAQSLVNEGLENVLFVCPTNDLVEQTKREADRVGIQVTTRTGSEFDNDLFESGKTFCVTNYHAVFNGLSALRRSYFPDAVIFDDAHVAALERFRKANSGAFVLVSRVDGIDLPHDTCRVMIIDGVPRSESYLERYQSEYLRMKRFMASRTANRLVQLGRRSVLS